MKEKFDSFKAGVVEAYVASWIEILSAVKK